MGATIQRVRRAAVGSSVLILLTLSACEPPSVRLPDSPEVGQSEPCQGGWTMRDAREARVIAFDPFGVPSFLSGPLGCLHDGPIDVAAWQFLEELRPVLSAAGDEELVAVDTLTDELGQSHTRFQEYLNGLEVVGGEYIVHASPATGSILAAGGRFVPDQSLPSTAGLAADEAMATALAGAGINSAVPAGPPVLVYVTSEEVQGALAWAQHVRYTDAAGDEQLDRIFADAISGALLARHPQFQRSLSRRVYDAGHGSSLPGSLVINEGGSSSDSVAQAAYDHTGEAWSFYSSLGRDSYNGSGAQIRSTVHYGSNYVNAYWNGSQLVFGDGDGYNSGPLAQALDVVAHELTHGVISYSADLNYYGESGALNEGFADIMGASAEAWADGGVSAATWKMGEDVWTPGQSGDALRYMDDPTADGQSYDYYPQRYTGSSDNGGVHLNSGIANLAYALLVSGGSHPRGKTSTSVPGIGISKAERIFYRALTVYMTSGTNFEGTRDATAQAAADLYGSAEVDAVHAAWDAVGVPGGPGPAPNPDPPGVTELSPGIPVPNLSDAAGGWSYFVISVPAGQDSLEIAISGGSGDADLYVRAGDTPTTSSYDFRPYLNGNNETVTVGTPTAGDWYIGIRGYSSFSGVTLVGSFGGSSPDPDPDPEPGVITLYNGSEASSLDGAQGSWRMYRVDLPAGVGSFQVQLWGGSGDADVYVRQGAQPTTSDWDFRPYLNGNSESVTVNSPVSGAWYIGVRGYQSYSGVTLKPSW